MSDLLELNQAVVRPCSGSTSWCLCVSRKAVVEGQMAVAVSRRASPYWMAHTMQTMTSMARVVVPCLQMVMQVALLLPAGQTRPCSSQVRLGSAPPQSCLTPPPRPTPHDALPLPNPAPPDPAWVPTHPSHALPCPCALAAFVSS